MYYIDVGIPMYMYKVIPDRVYVGCLGGLISGPDSAPLGKRSRRSQAGSPRGGLPK